MRKGCIGKGIVAFALLLVGTLALATPAGAQTITGTILGTVTDASRTGIPGASITIVNVETNRPVTTSSDAQGNYEVPLLKPGTYSVSVIAPGFQAYERRGLELTVGARLRADLALQVGQVTEKITVEARSGLVETVPGELSAPVNAQLLQELPASFGNLTDFTTLIPGVNFNDAMGSNYTGLTRGRAAEISVNGGRLKTNEMLIDGISVLMPRNGDFGAVPLPASVGEMRVVTSTPGAEFGRTGGGVFNIVTHGGTNRIHGSLWELHANHALNANSFFSNLRNQRIIPFRHNYYGASADGPVIRNRTFFHFSYQGAINNFGAQSGIFTVPTPEQLNGDFTQTLNASGKPVVIYDPETTRRATTGNTNMRDPFPGNRIPESRVNVVSRNVRKFYPVPNLPGDGPGKVNNFLSTAPFYSGYINYTGRIDHDFSSNHRFFGRLTRSWEDKHGRPQYGDRENPADPTMRHDQYPNLNIVLNDTLTINPHLLLNTRLGYSRAGDFGTPVHDDISLTNLGFAPMLDQVKADSYLPTFGVTGYASLGGAGRRRLTNNIWQVAGDLTWIRGRHAFKFGGDGRMYDQNAFAGAGESGAFNFASNFTQGVNPSVASDAAGSGVASFLLGLGTGSISSTPHLKIRSFYSAAFVSDDIRLGRLLINAGLRWEVETPRTERDNRLATFNFDDPLPMSLPSNSLNLRGYLTHAGQDGQSRGQVDPAWRNFSPRLGMAYTLDQKTVVRAGYGISYLPVFGANDATSFGITGVTGSISTSWSASIDSITPVYYLNNPFPFGALIRSKAPGDVYQIGQALVVADRSSRNRAYAQQWNTSLQREIGSLLVEVAYSGSKGTRMPVLTDFNQQPVRVMDTLKEGLIKSVPNPFYGIVTSGSLASSTISAAQLLRPYPQYGRIQSSSQNKGSSIYHGLQVRTQKRLSRGLTMQGAYTWSKAIDDFGGAFTTVTANTWVQDSFNMRGERAESEGSVAHKLVVSAAYSLPFGRGRTLLPGARGVLGGIVGGWSTNGMMVIQSGFPMQLSSIGNPFISVGKLRPNSTGASAHLDGRIQDRLNRYFDTSAFTIPEPYTIGNVSRTLSDVRTPPLFRINTTLLKTFVLTERLKAELSGQAINLTNTPYFQPNIGSQLGTSTFGVISASNGGRGLQFKLRLLF